MDSPGDRVDRARGALVGLTLGDHGEPALHVARELLDGSGAIDAARLATRLGGGDAARLAVIPAARVAPVGISRASEPAAVLLDLVEAADRPTHDTRIAHAGAAAVAMAVAAAVDGLDAGEILTRSLTAAADGGRRGRPTGGPDVAARISWACGLARATDEPLGVIELLVGTSAATQEAVPAAFAIATVYADPWAACQAAASLGGEADLIAALVGAMLGARHGLSMFPADTVAAASAGREADLIALADELCALRTAGPSGEGEP